ncbi:MAG: hypothetical protein JL50_02550 [Peptococcaceae bacterium BICA1-7]|nr:MAG: hypothetical protein JL50_02550 [Peptococcaceae bacterium BICA1-7]
MRAAFVLLAFILAAVIKLPAQVRGYSYEIYRESVRTYTDYQTRNLVTLESDHIKVKFQYKDDRYAGMVLEASERFYLPIAQKYGLQTENKITVLVYPSREELNASFGWPASENAMGVYWAGVIRVLSPASWVEDADPEEMLDAFTNIGPMAHEMTHLAVDYATRGNCPRWFTEGLAQLEEYNLTGFRFATDSDPGDNFYSLKDMDNNFDDLPDQALAYRESLSAVEYINSVYGEQKLLALVDSLGQGKGMGQSLENVLGVDIATFEQNWRSWSYF